MNLSEHFTLDEFTASQTAARRGIDNTPCQAAIDNLKRLCVLLEQVRMLFGKPVSISSGYRCSQLNMMIGGQEKSQHVLGCAADFNIQGVSLNDIISAIIANDLPFDQIIHEFDSWVHISVPSYSQPPRKQALIIDKQGTRPWILPD